MQCFQLHHRTLIRLFVVGIEVRCALSQHRAFPGAYPREVELRESLDDATEHFRTYVALARVHVVGDVLGGEVADPLEVALCLAQPLRLRPLCKFAEAADGGLFRKLPLSCFFGYLRVIFLATDVFMWFLLCHIRENDYICGMIRFVYTYDKDHEYWKLYILGILFFKYSRLFKTW